MLKSRDNLLLLPGRLRHWLRRLPTVRVGHLLDTDVRPVLLWSTYLAGSSDSAAFGGALALDGQGNVDLGGDTQSSDFPLSANALQASLGGLI